MASVKMHIKQVYFSTLPTSLIFSIRNITPVKFVKIYGELLRWKFTCVIILWGNFVLKKLLSVLLSVVIFSMSAVIFCNASAAKDYEGNAKKLDKTTFSGELGALYTKSATTFRVWAPTSDDVKVKFYKKGDSKDYLRIVNMSKNKSTGLWSVKVAGDHKNIFYTYVFTRGKKSYETYDIYAKACAANGKRSMVVDLGSTNPNGWDKDTHVTVDNPTDAMIWEVQVADFSSSKTSGVSEENRGKYLAFTERGTTVSSVAGAAPTCVSYLKRLGVNYVQINPFYDFGSVDETDKSGGDKNYNWGYDPINYNVPEGSYSKDPTNGVRRIIECKKMIQSLHRAGIGVIMDVVYNHTHESKDSAFNITVPDYYYRINPDGSWSNGSGCGNDTASERKMFSKYMTDSVLYWAKEYHVDGFRFDLMGLHDVKTMNHIRKKLDELDGGDKLLMYGEAWNLNTTADSGTILANQGNVKKLNDRIGAFDDMFRDAVKGSTSGADKGFVQAGEKRGNLETGITGQSDGVLGWANTPNQCVTYASCHDNLTLWDKLIKSVKGEKGEYTKRYSDLVAMNKLAGAITFTSQGTSFILAGEEFCRTKKGDENSYQSGFKINQLDWTSLQTFGDVSDYYKGLISLRRHIPSFRDNTDVTAKDISFIDDVPDGVLAYTLSDNKYGKVFVGFNSADKSAKLDLDGSYVQLVNEETAGLDSLGEVSGSVTIPARSAAVLVDKDSYNKSAKNKRTQGKVIVRYNVDGETFKSYTVSGKLNTSYNISPLTSVLMDYNIKKKSGDSGTFTENIRYCTFECEKYDGAYSSVSFECVDEKGNIISDTTVLSNRSGQPYETLQIPSVTGYTLDLQKLPKNGCGTFKDNDISVKYVYNKKPRDDKTCRVNIVYMSTEGKILGTNTLTGDAGSHYATTQLEIENYDFKSVTDNKSGEYALMEQNVLYIYSPVSVVSNVLTVILIVAGAAVLIMFAFAYYKRRRSELAKKLDIS